MTEEEYHQMMDDHIWEEQYKEWRMRLNTSKWVRIIYVSEGMMFPNDNLTTIISLVKGMIPKKSKSSIWIGNQPNTYNHLLVPDLTDENIMILRDLGYAVFKDFVSRSSRRLDFIPYR